MLLKLEKFGGKKTAPLSVEIPSFKKPVLCQLKSWKSSSSFCLSQSKQKNRDLTVVNVAPETIPVHMNFK